jgi:hypothetical protein
MMSFTSIAYLVDDKWMHINMAAGGITLKLIQNIINNNPIHPTFPPLLRLCPSPWFLRTANGWT